MRHTMRRGVKQLVNRHMVAVEDNGLCRFGLGVIKRQHILREIQQVAAALVSDMLRTVEQHEEIASVIALQNAALGRIGDGAGFVLGIMYHHVQPDAAADLVTGINRHAVFNLFKGSGLNGRQSQRTAGPASADFQFLHRPWGDVKGEHALRQHNDEGEAQHGSQDAKRAEARRRQCEIFIILQKPHKLRQHGNQQGRGEGEGQDARQHQKAQSHGLQNRRS